MRNVYTDTCYPQKRQGDLLCVIVIVFIEGCSSIYARFGMVARRSGCCSSLLSFGLRVYVTYFSQGELNVAVYKEPCLLLLPFTFVRCFGYFNVDYIWTEISEPKTWLRLGFLGEEMFELLLYTFI